MKAKKEKKENWLKRQFNKVNLLPWYWKMVASLLLFFLGGSFGMHLFTSASDLRMCVGFTIMALALWLIIKIWLPAKN